MSSRRSYIARLPADIREQINLKLYDGWQFQTIADWLFQQTADRDIPDLNLKTGDSYSLVWTRAAKDDKTAHETCRYRIARWYRTHYPDWLQKTVETSQAFRIFDRTEQLSAAAHDKVARGSLHGADVVIRALLLDAITKLREKDSDPDQLIELVNAWAKLR
jgi:hypothetical protein